MTLEVTQNTAGVTANHPGAARGNAATLASDFETFLKMLTAQARYQDPLDPIDSTEYAAQLAQFSMVEQQVLTNDRLAALSAGFDTFTAASLASWIGMETQAAAPAQFGGAPVTIAPSVAGGADAAVLVVKDASGAPVQRLPIGTSDSTGWGRMTAARRFRRVSTASRWKAGKMANCCLRRRRRFMPAWPRRVLTRARSPWCCKVAVRLPPLR